MADAATTNGTSQEAEQPKEVKELFRWSSPSRPFKKRDQRFYINLGLCLIVIGLLAIFLQEFLLVAVLLAIFFYLYISGTIEPDKIEHRITNQGITTASHSYIWKELNDFWLTEKYGETIITVGTKVRYPGRLFMIVPEENKEKVRAIIVKFLPYREVPPSTQLDDLVEWLTNKLPASMR